MKRAEHLARNKNWDDEKKRFFSDRLKGEALEWHNDFVEHQEDELNYRDWNATLVARFQNAYDLPTLKKKISKLTEKTRRKLQSFCIETKPPV